MIGNIIFSLDYRQLILYLLQENDKEVDIPVFDIPIFTEEFLDYNKSNYFHSNNIFSIFMYEM